MKWILHYLRATANVCLAFDKNMLKVGTLLAMWILILQVTKRREDLYQVIFSLIFSLSITLQLVGKLVYILLLLYQPLQQNKF